MDVISENLESKKNLYTLEINNVDDVSLLNCLRRIISMEIPYAAFNNIQIIENTSLLHNEFIQHRVELIPININYIYLENYNDTILKLKVEHDDLIKKNDRVSVLSKNFTVDGKKTELIKPYSNNYHFPLTKLCFGQKLDLNAKIKIGTGKEHSKFMTTSQVFYTYDAEDCTKKTVYKFKIEGCDHNYGPIPLDKLFQLGIIVLLYKVYILKCQIIGKKCIYINLNIKNKYLLAASKIIFKYIRGINKNFLEENNISDLILFNHKNNIYEIELYDEDYGIGNLITGYLYKITDVAFVCCDKAHPSENKILLLMKLK